MIRIKTLDTQLEKRPKNIQFCTKCVVSNQRPKISFDKKGVCSACRYAEEKNTKIDWNLREKELKELLLKYRSKDGSYDCIVPSSGGKDSGYVAYQLKNIYGMHPLTVTWAPFIYTDIGWKNYINFKDAGYDNLLFFPNGILHRKLAKTAFIYKGDAWEPFAYGQKAFAFHIALKFNIPLIFYGENGNVEYGGSTKNTEKPYESVKEWEELYFKGAGIDRILAQGLESGILHRTDFRDNDFYIYKTPNLDGIKKLGLQMHWMSYYKKWIPQENYYTAVEYTKFCANPIRTEGTYSKYASIDDKLDGFHYYMAYIKFGIARTTADASHEIRDGHITREEGISLVRRYDGEFPQRYFKEFLNYISMSEEQFWDVVNYYRTISPHIWKKEGNNWILKKTVYEHSRR